MPTHGTDGNGGLGGAAKQVAERASALARLEIELAKLELGRKVASIGIGIGLGLGAALFALFGLGFLLAAAAAALATAISTWLAILLVGAGLFRPTARLTPAATYWMNRPARPPLPGRLTRLGSWPSVWRECGSPVPGGLAPRADVRRSWRMRFTVTSSWAGPGGAAAGRRSGLHSPVRVSGRYLLRL